MSKLLIKNVNVIPMTEEVVLEGQNVLINDNMIESLNYDGDTSGIEVVDGSGKFMIPGLHDMHAHLKDESQLPLMLVHGVTTIREMMGIPVFFDWKNEIKEKKRFGPNMYMCSYIFEGEGASAMSSMQPDSFVTTNDPELARQKVREFRNLGFDFIKVYDLVTNEVYDAILDECKKLNIPLVGHVPEKVGYEKASKSGQRSFEHILGTETDEDIKYACASDGWVVPTVTCMDKFDFIWSGDRNEYLENDPNTKYISKQLLDVWKFACNLKTALDPETLAVWEERSNHMKASVVFPILKKMYDGGAKLAAGTDQGIQFMYPGICLLEELENYTKAGLTKFDTLKTATINAAELLGNEDISGTVGAGKLANLVILNSNPLEDTSAVKDIFAVIKEGDYLSRQKLDELLEDVVKFCDATKVEEVTEGLYDGVYKKIPFKMNVKTTTDGVEVTAMGNKIAYLKCDEAHKFIGADDDDIYVKFNFENDKVVSMDSRFMGKVMTIKKAK